MREMRDIPNETGTELDHTVIGDRAEWASVHVRTGWRVSRGRPSLLRGTVPTLVAVLIAGCGGGGTSTLKPAEQAPKAAESVATHVIAPNGKVATGAFTRAAATLLPGGAGLPPGSELELDPKAWRQTGRFANSTALLLIPHKAPQYVEVGFMLTTAGWRVTFLEGAS